VSVRLELEPTSLGPISKASPSPVRRENPVSEALYFKENTGRRTMFKIVIAILSWKLVLINL
jgi:hypothetical protein